MSMLNLNFARLLMMGSFLGSVPGMLRWMSGSRVVPMDAMWLLGWGWMVSVRRRP